MSELQKAMLDSFSLVTQIAQEESLLQEDHDAVKCCLANARQLKGRKLPLTEALTLATLVKFLEEALQKPVRPVMVESDPSFETVQNPPFGNGTYS